MPKIPAQQITTSDGQPQKEKKVFRGLWDVYEDKWFDIQSKNLRPLFVEIPSPSKQMRVPPKLQLPLTNSQQQLQHAVSKTKLKKIDDDSDIFFRKCDICTQKKKRGSQVRCGHFVCRDCLQNHIKKELDLRRIPIKCPKGGCKHHLDNQEINKFAPSTELVRRHYELSVATRVEKNPHQLVQCYTQGCGYVVNLTKLKQKDQLDCPRCKKSYCIRCHKLSHKSPTCSEDE